MMLMMTMKWRVFFCSVRSCRVRAVLLEPSVLSGVLQRRDDGRLGHLRHDGAHRRVVRRRRTRLQGDRRYAPLDSRRSGVRRRDRVLLLVCCPVRSPRL